MSWVKLSLEQQLGCAKSEDAYERLAFSIYPVLPEVADYIVEHEKDKRVIERIFTNLFMTPNSEIWSTTLSKAAKIKVKNAGISEKDSALVNIALHLNTDVETLTYLHSLNNNFINWGLASNPNTPKVILEKLSEIKYFDIDDALLYNPNTPKEIREKISARYKEGFFSTGYFYDHQGIKVNASGN